jgi:murein L,D-transpeptidase YafK
MHLMHDQTALKTYRFNLGFAPTGHKQVEGDGRTPEGAYRINRRNPNSAYHLSIGISYPNDRDREVARALGKPPGGDIFIHGTPSAFAGKPDWTWGCIAVTNEEIEEVYAMVQDGTPVFIYA